MSVDVLTDLQLQNMFLDLFRDSNVELVILSFFFLKTRNMLHKTDCNNTHRFSGNHSFRIAVRDICGNTIPEHNVIMLYQYLVSSQKNSEDNVLFAPTFVKFFGKLFNHPASLFKDCPANITEIRDKILYFMVC